MRALRKTPATQPPTGVPPKGGPATFAVVTRPLVANVTCTLPLPVGPPGFAQLPAFAAACVRATWAAETLKGALPWLGISSAFGAAALGSFGSFGVLGVVVVLGPFTPGVAALAVAAAVLLGAAEAEALAAGFSSSFLSSFFSSFAS